MEPNTDGSYTSPGDGWVELDPAIYGYDRMNIAYVDGTLSFIGEDRRDRKALTPWFSDPAIEDATMGIAWNLSGAGSLVRLGAKGALGAIVRGAGQKSVREIVSAVKKDLLEYWRREQRAGTAAGRSGGHSTPNDRVGAGVDPSRERSGEDQPGTGGGLEN